MFNDAVNFVFENEGGLFEDPKNNDICNFGITQKLLIAIKWQTTDPRNLTLEDAKGIMYSQFWEPNHLDDVKDVVIQRKLLDMFVNMGAHEGTLILQRALSSLNEQVATDGTMGTTTIKAVNEVLSTHVNGKELLLNQIKDKSVEFYKTVAEKNPSKAQYLKGWIARAGKH